MKIESTFLQNLKCSSKPFLEVEAIERKIFVDLMRNSKEFFKMDEVDKTILAWMVLQTPQRIESWIDYVVLDYDRKKGGRINPKELIFDLRNNIF